MPIARPAAVCRLCAASLLWSLLPSAGQAAAHAIAPADYGRQAITCEFPVRLSHDCSIWQGPTRPIALGDYRMSMAADDEGRTVFISRLRPGPSHNGDEFHRTPDHRWPRHSSREAIRQIGAALADRGIRLERTWPARRGRDVTGYFLEFSDNAYDVLKQFTVLESEYWLPSISSVR